jgi:hypothetical protein|tara:strand:+ start:1384 stop:1773 length:390 start_codon:yes stop_codon:yes gene_type:complete
LENTTGIGLLGELAVRKELHRQGFNVYIPQCDNDQVDMIVENKHGAFHKVNVKTATKMTTSTSIEVKLHKHRHSGRVDVLAIYYIPEDIIAFIPYMDQSTINLALRNAKNNQQDGRNWFWAYTEYPEFE